METVETSGERPLRKDIPINLPPEQETEAEALRNKLLLYRFRKFGEVSPRLRPLDASLEARINQIYSPLAAVIEDEETRADLRRSARGNSSRLKAERGATMDAQVLTVIRSLMEQDEQAAVAVKQIRELFVRVYGGDYERPVTDRWVGQLIRRRLNLSTHKSHGNYVITFGQLPKLAVLYERYGVSVEDAGALRVVASENMGDDGERNREGGREELKAAKGL